MISDLGFGKSFAESIESSWETRLVKSQVGLVKLFPGIRQTYLPTMVVLDWAHLSTWTGCQVRFRNPGQPLPEK